MDNERLGKLLSQAGFGLIAATVTLAPWLFGAWEMWWFWSFSMLIFLATALFSVRMILFGPPRLVKHQGIHQRQRGKILVVTCLPFLFYAAIRAFQADVWMDAERSLLLFITPVLLGAQILFGFSRKQLHWLYVAVLANIFLLAAYGIINHLVTGSEKVLWAPGYAQYYLENRASGSYFCPDHCAGVLELGFCLCLGLLLDRKVRLRTKTLAAIISIVCLAGVVLSRSRGGGLTILVILGTAVVWGFGQWAPERRWHWRGAAAGMALVLVIAFSFLASGYMGRFVAYFQVDGVQHTNRHEKRMLVMEKLKDSTRGRMYDAAIRAWKTAPMFGIGPGMHQNTWPHFAASADGNRETGVWPSRPNHTFHSYEVHSDWLQLLQEYGNVGFLLFLFPCMFVFWVLERGLHSESSEWLAGHWSPPRLVSSFYIILGALLALACMGFHSLGDFNLQMPATTWMLAAILAVGMALSLRPPVDERHKRPPDHQTTRLPGNSTTS